MNRVLMIDGDRTAMQTLGLACLERGLGVLMAENLCEGGGALLTGSVSIIVVDVEQLRLAPREHAALFERVAPGVPVVVVVRPKTALDVRVGFELAGFHVVTRPPAVEDLLAKALGSEAPCGL